MVEPPMTPLYPWLQAPYQQIRHAFAEGYGHHALLFKADSGLGAERLVEQVAQGILCQQAPKPCGQCHGCRLFTAGSHPDYYPLASIDDKDIGVDQVREINEKLSQHAQQNGNKVVVIHGAQRLTEAAANALLKTLEEPRPNSYFLLLTELSASLLPTIQSRCQTWLLTAPALEQGTEWLQAQSAADFSDILTALRVNYQRPLAALAFLQQDLGEKRKTLISQFWKFYQRSDILQILPYFEKDIIFQQLDWLSAFLSDSLKAKLGIQQGWICQDFDKAVSRFAEQNSREFLLAANQGLHKMRADIVEINAVNQEIMLIDGLSGLVLAKA